LTNVYQTQKEGDIEACGVGLILVRCCCELLKNCGVAVMKNFAMCGVYVILRAVYGEVDEFCGNGVLLNFCVVLTIDFLRCCGVRDPPIPPPKTKQTKRKARTPLEVTRTDSYVDIIKIQLLTTAKNYKYFMEK